MHDPNHRKNKSFIWLLWVGGMFLLGAGAVILLNRLPGFGPHNRISLDNSVLSASLNGGSVRGDDPSDYDLSQHQTLSRVIWLVRENYVDIGRVKPYDMFAAGLDAVQKQVPEVMIDMTEAPKSIRVSVGNEAQQFALGKLDQLWEITMALRDVFRFLQQHIEDAEERRNVEYAAINGMLSTLDPHSVLLRPESFEDVKMSTKGEFGGLGIVISIRDNSLTVMSPIEGTPASRAGVKAKDKIVRIGEESTINMGLDEAVDMLRGPPGTQVVVWLQRKGWKEPRKFRLTRAKIKIESVTSRMLDANVGYIKIKNFQGNTYDDLDAHLNRLERDAGGKITGLILDLRNNPGGLLDQAIEISDRFIERGALVITQPGGGKTADVKNARRSGTDTEYPMAVLVNGGSASASEIVSGALKNHDRAVVIGQQTFGKGSVQVLYNFKDDSALKLTIAQYLTPGNISIQSVGITPDIEILPATIAKEGLHFFSETMVPREKDLDRHLVHASAKATQRPTRQLVHYVADEDLTEEDTTPADGFRYDFETQLAHELLQGAKSTEREAMLKQARVILNRFNDKEEGQIAAKFSELGVDWTAGQNKAAKGSKLHAALTTSVGDQPTLKAGESFMLTASVTNRGSQPVRRLFGVTDSENPLLNHLEFAFGAIEPGQTKTWDVEVKVPSDISALGASLELVVQDIAREISVKSAPLLVAMAPLNKPLLQYNARIDDAAGNRDGALQVGEKVKVKVKVHNAGGGPAEDVLVTLKNLSGGDLLLDKGRQRLGKIAVGQSKEAELVMTVQRKAPSVDVRISVGDTNAGVGFANKVTYPVLAPRPFARSPKVLKPAHAEAIPLYSGASQRMPVVGYAGAAASLMSDGAAGDWRRVRLGGGQFGFVQESKVKLLASKGKGRSKGVELKPGQGAPKVTLLSDGLITDAPTYPLEATIQDRDALQDVLVFVNDRKVHYQSLRGVDASNPYDLKLTVPLKEGHNTVSVIVRETEELVAREVLGVFRKPTTAMAKRRD